MYNYVEILKNYVKNNSKENVHQGALCSCAILSALTMKYIIKIEGGRLKDTKDSTTKNKFNPRSAALCSHGMLYLLQLK